MNRTPPKPMGWGSKIFVWTMLVFILLVSVGSGLFGVSYGLVGRDALATGLVGTFTPTEKPCGRSGCHLEGTFTSDDGTVTHQDVVLRDSVRNSSSAPLPPPIDDVRLVTETNRSEPLAYTTGYSWVEDMLMGIGFAVAGIAFTIFAAVKTRRYQARAIAAHGRGR